MSPVCLSAETVRIIAAIAVALICVAAYPSDGAKAALALVEQGQTSVTTVKTCKAGTHSIELSLEPNMHSVSFKCGDTNDGKLEPSTTEYFTGDDVSQQKQNLTTAFADATLDAEGENGNKAYKLSIGRETRTAEKDLYYTCTFTNTNAVLGERRDGENPQETKCKVKITVKPFPQSQQGTNDEQGDQPNDEQGDQPNDEQQAGPIECTDADTTKETSASAESPLSFKCGAGMSLRPTNLTDVFDDQDGKCAAEVALQTLVDATLTKTETEATQKGQPVYQLAVKTAPPEDTALCYKCVPSSSSDTETEIQSEGESSAKECLLKISVKGSASSAFSPTWGPAHGAAAFFVAAQLLRGMVDA
ncbi:SRS domain-containing protein [Neospora caninum Liverpool]|uniref:SRS domain-containing protein n=1 Tax=Neospora caninum (strain Liverpool) TaxID=572307 RepID=F0VL99_NEOCL|nr:SRS domain-containing protein [Neospora caninum Liverpool]CBZ54851.1 SRS domain-containing protein [Neospora caninum Liverpool]CEL69570.1 TPA: SRS domain-containing protein [Neospora caninum Liverpool]|eukprot:XP_003884879.1 SRS domain-containing protein [Neospora caninum Liverpool]